MLQSQHLVKLLLEEPLQAVTYVCAVGEHLELLERKRIVVDLRLGVRKFLDLLEGHDLIKLFIYFVEVILDVFYV